MKTETKEIIELVKPVTKGIIELYEELARLEADHLEITEEYFQTIVKLNTSIKLEYEIISRIFDNIEETIKALEYLSNIGNEEIKSISIANKEELINRRILEIIRNYTISNPEKIIESSLQKALKEFLSELKKAEIDVDAENLFEVISEDEIEQTKKTIKERTSYYIYRKAIQYDMNMLFIIILNGKIENAHNKRVKKELIKAKYLKISVTPLIEEPLLNQAFKIPNELYQSIYMLPSLYGIDPNMLERIINEIKLQTYNNQVELLMTDKTLSYISKSELELILREIKIRVALSYFTEEEIITVNEDFHECIDEFEKKGLESFIIDARETFTKAFKSFNQDKKLIKKVTL